MKLFFFLVICLWAIINFTDAVNWKKYQNRDPPVHQNNVVRLTKTTHPYRLNPKNFGYAAKAGKTFRVLDVYPSGINVKNDETQPECRVVTPPTPPASKNQTLWELLDEARGLLKLNENYREVVLMMGNTGSGKSTLTHLIAGNVSQMELVQNPDGVELIIDENGSIGQTTASQTIVPELVVDNTTTPHLAIYDSPGFADNRGADTDITANFLLKAVTDHVTKVTLAFVVIHSSVSGTNDKTDFDRLVTHAINLVKDLEHYNPAIGLIVSKAPNVNSGNGKPLTDQQIQKTVISFIQMYRQDQVNQLNSLRTDRQTLLKKIEFVDILLSNNNDRIWHMRIAARCGLLSDDPAAMKTRKELRNLVTKNLTIIPSKPEDFGWALTGETLLKVNDYVEEINQNITSLGNKLIAEVKTIQNDQRAQLLKFNESNAFIQDENTAFTNLWQLISSNKTITNSPALLALEVQKTLRNRNYDSSVSKGYVNALNQLDEYLNFFEAMKENQIDRDSTNWIKPFSTFQEEVQKINEWYEYVAELRNKLSEYSFQQYKPNKSVPSNPNLEFVKELGLNVPSRIDQIFNTNNLLIWEDKNLLKIILDIGMKKTQVTCNGDKMLAKGAYVVISEITNSNGEFKSCGNTEQIEIFASEKLFMNRNVKQVDKEIQELGISAPEWEVTTDVKIDFNGLGGNVRSLNHQIVKTKRHRGKSTRSGEHGAVGKPGYSAGRLYGLSGSISSGKRLTVTAIGGTGTDGSRGSTGTKGSQGTANNFDNWPSCWNAWNSKDDGKNYFDKKGEINSITRWYKRWGSSGYTGGRGGDGGRKGEGGYPGEAEILQLDKSIPSTAITQQVQKGADGSNGAGGSGGEGGDTGAGVYAEINMFIACGYNDIRSLSGSDWPARKGANGSSGTTGGNTQGLQPPTKPNFTINHDTFVRDYKSFVKSVEVPQFPNDFVHLL